MHLPEGRHVNGHVDAEVVAVIDDPLVLRQPEAHEDLCGDGGLLLRGPGLFELVLRRSFGGLLNQSRWVGAELCGAVLRRRVSRDLALERRSILFHCGHVEKDVFGNRARSELPDGRPDSADDHDDGQL